MSNLFVSINGFGKYFDEDIVIEEAENITVCHDHDDVYWVSVGNRGFYHTSDEEVEESDIEIDGEPLQDFVNRYCY